MGVDHATDVIPGAVESQVGGRVGGGPAPPIDELSVSQAHEHDVVGGHGLVGDATGLDRDHALVTVDPAHVAPAQLDQAVFGQHAVGRQYLSAELVQHG